MATVGSINSQGTTNDQSTTDSTTAKNSLGNEQAFLTLLDAQLKNQDPMQPQDGTQFVTQLAQFTNLEQNLAIRADMDAVRNKYAPADPSSDSSSTNPVTN